MYAYFISLLYLLLLNFCAPQTTTNQIATITSSPIRRPHLSEGGGRLSLINYRFNRRPKKKNLDIRELKLVLGSGFDPQFMSIEQPSEMNNPDGGAIYVYRQDTWKYAEIVKELQTSNFTDELKQLAGEKLQIGPEHVKTIEKWLLRKASCPVKYAWEDIGALFWPRYVRRGECTTDQGSCSWPSGMHCVPSGTTNITILRWQCRAPKGPKGQKGRSRRRYKGAVTKNYKEEEKPLNLKCSWVRVPYPVTSECMCTC